MVTSYKILSNGLEAFHFSVVQYGFSSIVDLLHWAPSSLRTQYLWTHKTFTLHSSISIRLPVSVSSPRHPTQSLFLHADHSLAGSFYVPPKNSLKCPNHTHSHCCIKIFPPNTTSLTHTPENTTALLIQSNWSVNLGNFTLVHDNDAIVVDDGL
jgi:hypothetical protein